MEVGSSSRGVTRSIPKAHQRTEAEEEEEELEESEEVDLLVHHRRMAPRLDLTASGGNGGDKGDGEELQQLHIEVQQLRTTLVIRDQQLVDVRAGLDRTERTYREEVAIEHREAKRQATRVVYYYALYIGAMLKGQ